MYTAIPGTYMYINHTSVTDLAFPRAQFIYGISAGKHVLLCNFICPNYMYYQSEKPESCERLPYFDLSKRGACYRIQAFLIDNTCN